MEKAETRQRKGRRIEWKKAKLVEKKERQSEWMGRVIATSTSRRAADDSASAARRLRAATVKSVRATVTMAAAVERTTWTTVRMRTALTIATLLRAFCLRTSSICCGPHRALHPLRLPIPPLPLHPLPLQPTRPPPLLRPPLLPTYRRLHCRPSHHSLDRRSGLVSLAIRSHSVGAIGWVRRRLGWRWPATAMVSGQDSRDGKSWAEKKNGSRREADHSRSCNAERLCIGRSLLGNTPCSVYCITLY